MPYSVDSVEKSMSPRIYGVTPQKTGQCHVAANMRNHDATQPYNWREGKPPRQHDTHITWAVSFTFLSPRKGSIQQATYWPLQQVWT